MRTFVLVLCLIAAASSARADDVKEDFKKIGKDFKKLGQTIGQEAKKTGQAIGQEAAVGGRKVAAEAEKIAPEAKKSGKGLGERFRSAFRELGLGIKSGWGRLVRKPAGKKD